MVETLRANPARVTAAASSSGALMTCLREAFENRGATVTVRENEIEAFRIAPESWGATSRNDITTVTVKKNKEGFQIVPNIAYEPSSFFWGWLVLSIPLWIGVIGPVIDIILAVQINKQKTVVREAVASAVTAALHQFETVPALPPTAEASTQIDTLDALSKLADLRDRGAITEEQFEAKRKELLA